MQASCASFGRDSLMRTLAQLHEGEQNPDTILRAREWIIRNYEWPIRKVFDHIQEHMPDNVVERVQASARRRAASSIRFSARSAAKNT